MLIAALIHSPQGIYKEDSGADLGEVSNGCDVTDWIHLSQANVMSRKESITEIKKLIAFHWISAYTVDLLMCCLCLSRVKTRQWRETGNESPEKEPHHFQGKDVYSYKTSRPLLRQLTLSHLVTRTQYPKYKKTMICMPLDQAWGNPATEYFLSDSNSEKKKKLKAAREKTYLTLVSLLPQNSPAPGLVSGRGLLCALKLWFTNFIVLTCSRELLSNADSDSVHLGPGPRLHC